MTGADIRAAINVLIVFALAMTFPIRFALRDMPTIAVSPVEFVLLLGVPWAIGFSVIAIGVATGFTLFVDRAIDTYDRRRARKLAERATDEERST